MSNQTSSARSELFVDEVEEIRSLAVADQRSLEHVPAGLWAPPCRDLLPTEEVGSRARALAAVHPELAEMLEKLAEGHAVEGMESLAPVLVDNMELLVDLLLDRSFVLACDPERVRARTDDLVALARSAMRRPFEAHHGARRLGATCGCGVCRPRRMLIGFVVVDPECFAVPVNL